MVPYFISNFPGCTDRHMRVVDRFLEENHWSPQQVQDFMPLAMTMGCAMYCSGLDAEGHPIEVHRGLAERRGQRDVLHRKHGGPPDRRGKPPFAGPKRKKPGR